MLKLQSNSWREDIYAMGTNLRESSTINENNATLIPSTETFSDTNYLWEMMEETSVFIRSIFRALFARTYIGFLFVISPGLICACVLIFLIIIFPQILCFIVICAIDLHTEIYVQIDATS